MANNFFKLIKSMVNRQISNEYGNAKYNQDGLSWDSIKTRFYPQGQVMWLVKNNIATLDSVTVDKDTNGKYYVIKFKEFNLDNPFFKAEKRRTLLASQLRGYQDSEENGKFANREDMQRSYSQSRVDDEYYVADETRYEKLSLEDNCTFELYLQKLGYNSYRDFILEHENDTQEFREILDEDYRNFLEEISSKEYEI